jgi:mobilome CxxCx(11)CxxC protein
MDANARDQIRQRCWDGALEAFGTGYIFEKRANRLRYQLRILTFLGIVAPLMAGAVVLAFGKGALFPAILIPAGILGIVQVVGSLWSLVARWDDAYGYSVESMNANYRLSNHYQKLAENPPDSLPELQVQFGLLDREDEFRGAEDYKQAISEKEKRKGMRAALRKFRRECASCNRVPESMKPTDCPTCGQF